MKRVLMVSCGGLGNGGVQAIMMGIIRSLRSEYYFDFLLFTDEVRHYDKEFLSYGGKIFRIPLHVSKTRIGRRFDEYTQDFYNYKSVSELLRQQPAYDIIHCNKEFESAAILMAAKHANIPVRICHTHVISSSSGKLLTVVNSIRKKLIARSSTINIGCSEQACVSFYDTKAKYEIVNNFYDDKRFTYCPLGKNDEAIIFTQVGALSENKNQIFSIKVINGLVQRGFNVKLNIVGFELQSGVKQKLVNLVNELGLVETVSFMPGDTNIPELLSNTNIFIMPSYKEGFGIALIEAQAAGVYCIASASIPRTTDCGNVVYLPVEKEYDISIWVEHITSVISTEAIDHHISDTQIYKQSVVMKQYRCLYER